MGLAKYRKAVHTTTKHALPAARVRLLYAVLTMFISTQLFAAWHPNRVHTDRRGLPVTQCPQLQRLAPALACHRPVVAASVAIISAAPFAKAS